MQSSAKIVILIIATTTLSCGIILSNPKKPKTIIKKEELINFRISIDEEDDVARQGIKAKLYINNIYHEKLEIQIPDCLRVAAPNLMYNNGYPVPMRSTIKETCEPEWEALEPGDEFTIEYPYNLFHDYYLESGIEFTVQFSYYGEIRDSKSEFLSGDDDVIQSNVRKIRLVEY